MSVSAKIRGALVNGAMNHPLQTPESRGRAPATGKMLPGPAPAGRRERDTELKNRAC